MPERHEKLADGLRLILLLSGSRAGRTLNELAQEFGVGRRTIERMLAAIREVCGELEQVPSDEAQKRWRLPPSPLARVQPLTAAEVAELDLAARRLAAEGLAERAALLRGAAEKLRAAMDARALQRAEPDVEALLANEGIAMRPGPRVQVPEPLITTLRQAILATRLVRLRYSTGRSNAREHLVEPYGLLYGQRPYLLAARRDKPDAAVWRLDRILAAEVTEQPFTPRPGFELPKLAAQSFGVWREPPVEVVLRFREDAAREAANWLFHPTQRLEPQPDGTLLLRFTAGGLEEMAHHLATWGEAVEVIRPDALRARLAALGAALLRRHGAAAPAEA
ncbi:helix-turn-helix transcriptional regulator [Rubritepida flocculans]|uniref:helix-turn-helix transcriptional regulator n=1 Tax=Rubritepida flocculans TaxID=182403 RepID=UPI0003FD2987|nr:WYL domain-containing protein [Rubritepida flocculans]